MAFSGAGVAAIEQVAEQAATPVVLAHAVQGQNGQRGSQWCPLGMMGPRYDMGQGMMAPGQGYGMGPGMMGRGPGYGPAPGYGMNPGMMGRGPGYGPAPRYGMGPGMMDPDDSYGERSEDEIGPGMMGPDRDRQGMMAPRFRSGPGDRVMPSRHLTADDVRHFLEHRLDMHGNKRLKVGEVKEADGDTIVAEITTVDGSLVERLEVDRHSGRMREID